MIKIDIDDNIIKKHIKYLTRRCEKSNEILIVRRLKEFQKETKYFKEDFIKVLIESKGLEEKESKLFNTYSRFEKRKLLKDNYLFLEFIINEVKELDSIKNINLHSNNLFIGKPFNLNENIKYINKKYRYICEYISLLPNKEKGREYVNDLIDAIGYNKFSTESMKSLHFHDIGLIESIKSMKKYKDVFGKVYGTYSIKRIEDIRKIMIEDIDKILDINIKDEKFSKLINDELKNKILDIKIEDINGNSIGIGRFEDEVKLIIDEIVKKIRLIDEKPIDLFNIDLYNEKNDVDWGAYQFLMLLGIKTCPYCNRQYIHPLYSNNGKVRADLDHFLPKYKYPYLSLSIFNMVPSCKFCNSSLKSTKDFKYEDNINPYEMGFGELCRFNYGLKNHNSYISEENITLYLTYNDEIKNKELIKKIKRNVEVFQIENLYKYHSKDVANLVKRKIIYSDDYIDDLMENYKDLFNSEVEIKELLLDTNFKKESSLDQPLSKLKKDILYFLGEI